MIQIPDAESGPSIDARLEALLFAATEPIPARRLAELLEADAEAVEGALARLRGTFSGEGRGVHLVEIAGGYRFLTNPLCAESVAALVGRRESERLSAAAVETLAIIAYKQPVSRAEIERIRGVGVGPVLRTLLEIDLVKVVGREEELGRALLYGTTKAFLDRFGLKNVKDLPASLEI